MPDLDRLRQAGTTNVGDEIEAFDLPPGLDPDCVSLIFTDGFESGDTSAWSGSVCPSGGGTSGVPSG